MVIAESYVFYGQFVGTNSRIVLDGDCIKGILFNFTTIFDGTSKIWLTRDSQFLIRVTILYNGVPFTDWNFLQICFDVRCHLELANIAKRKFRGI